MGEKYVLARNLVAVYPGGSGDYRVDFPWGGGDAWLQINGSFEGGANWRMVSRPGLISPLDNPGAITIPGLDGMTTGGLFEFRAPEGSIRFEIQSLTVDQSYDINSAFVFSTGRN